MYEGTEGSVIFIETTRRFAPVAVYLHKLKQHKAVKVLGQLSECHKILLVGQLQGVVLSNPVLLIDHLARSGMDYSYEESRNLFRFIKRLLKVL